MGNPRGFLEIERSDLRHRAVCERIKDYEEVALLPTAESSREQGSRCMDCGTPFCHWACPIGNYIPEWNDLLFHNKWQRALEILGATNNFPEITGRLCPALCEYSCVLGINDDPVTIKQNELAIIEYAFRHNLIKARKPKSRTGKSVAVVGSGPAALACADQLNKAGHRITVFEKDDKVGGILRYGIPDFKLDKKIIDRRVEILRKEGIKFVTGANVGVGVKVDTLKKDFDAVCLACGSRVPRDLRIEGRELSGIHFAMDYLVQSNRIVGGERVKDSQVINASGKRVVVIGGGDTGADCVGTAHRQGAACVIQIEVLPRPPECRTPESAWPKYPLLLKTSSSHEEGGERHWAVLTKRFTGKEGRVKKIACVKVDFSKKDKNSCPLMQEIRGSEFDIEADLVILAIGFVHPEHSGLIEKLGLELDNKGNIKTDPCYMTSAKKVFAAGDARRGQSLIVWAISEGRRAAHCIDKYLMGRSDLPGI